MKQMLRLGILAAAILMTLPGSARAADMDGDSSFGIHPYIGLAPGVYDLKVSTVGINQSNNVFGGFVRLGADFNPYLGAELRISGSDKGKSSYPAGRLVTQQIRYLFSYLAKLQYPATQELSIYGLVGGTSGNVSIHDSANPGAQLGGRVATGLSYGAGLDYKVDDFMHVGLEYMRYWNGVKINKASVWPNTTKENIEGITATLRIDL